MNCRYCKNWDRDGDVCKLVSLAPRPYFHIVPGGCFPWQCAYVLKELDDLECPKCACDKPEYPDGKHLAGCPNCSGVDKYGNAKSGKFCECGVRVACGIEYPENWKYDFTCDECSVAEPYEGAFEKLLDEQVWWYSLPIKNRLTKYFEGRHEFAKDGCLKSKSAPVTVRELIETLSHDVLVEVFSGRYKQYLKEFNKELSNQFGIFVGVYDYVFRRGSFWTHGDCDLINIKL